MEMALLTADFSWPRGEVMAVILAGQGVMKNTPTSSGRQSWALQNSARAIWAATSMG